MDIFFNMLLICVGGICVIFSITTYIKQNRLKKYGLKTEAKFVGYSYKKKASIKVPIFIFWHKDENNYYEVKGKLNSLAKSGEVTPIYFNLKKPSIEYYLPKKDFLMKYILLFYGIFFICLGILYMIKTLSGQFNNKYFLILFISLFSGTLILYLIGRLSIVTWKK